MKKNIGIFSTHPLWPSHFETDLELIQTNVNKNNNIILFHCNSHFGLCELLWNKHTNEDSKAEETKNRECKKCGLKQNAGYDLIKGSISKYPIFSQSEISKDYILDDYYTQNIKQLKQLVIDETYLVGWSLLSSLISKYREPFIDVSLHKTELSSLYQDCCRMYYSVKEYIEKYNLHEVTVFNGRFSYTKAVLDAAISMNINCYVHERGADLSKYSLYKNHSIHNMYKFAENVNIAWNNEKDSSLKEKIATQFYRNRQNNIIGSWASFLDSQDPSLLPDNWDKAKHNITFYTSSEDEFVSISPEWNGTLFSSQLESLKHVAHIISNTEGYHMYIRQHPNLKGMSQEYLDSFNELGSYKDVTLINADSSVSTYQLLEHSNKIIAYASTMTFEALHAGKPSILLGKNLYYYLKGPHIPINKEEVEELVLNKNLTVPENDALKLGYYLKTFGIDFKYYKALNYKTGKFKGVNLNEAINPDWVKPPFLIRVKNKLKKIMFNN